MKKTSVLLVIAMIVMVAATGCHPRKKSCAAYDKVEVPQQP